MKPHRDDIAIVTASIDPVRAHPCMASWLARAWGHLPVYVVWSELPDQPPMTVKDRQAAQHAATVALIDSFTTGVTIINHQGGGVVPAFAKGVASAIADGAHVIVALHDDLLIEEDDWDLQVLRAYEQGVKFMGFGGATSLGCASLYHDPYDPMQLARGGFVSNMRDAEVHGKRSRTSVRCVCFDGFSQIGTSDWFGPAWEWLAASGCIHHAYDLALACLAARAKVQPGLMLPVRLHHYGGATAVGSAAYNEWARTQNPNGDQGFWLQSHQLFYSEFRDVLPLRVEQFR